VATSGHQWPSVVISGHQWPSAVISGPHLPRGLMKSEPLITRVTKVSPRERWHCPPSNEPMSSEALATAPAQLPALPALASWSAIGACSYVDAPTRKRAQSEAIRCNQRQSEAIGGNRRPSEAIRGHQRPSEAIRGNQLRTEVHRPLDSTQVVREDVEVDGRRKGRCMRMGGDTGERGGGATE